MNQTPEAMVAHRTNRSGAVRLIKAAITLFLLADLAVVGFYFGTVFQRNADLFELPPARNLSISLRQFLRLEKSYSQMEQDRWVVHSVFPGVRNGYYVDVGSADGVLISNTKLLDELGWQGVCIEPFPTNMASRTCRLFQQPVYDRAGVKVKFRKAGVLGGIDQNIDSFKERVKDDQVVEMTTTTLADVLAEAKAPAYIHYMSLDIEGAELEALKAFPFEKYRIGALTVEHNFEEPKRSQIREYLVSKGYRRVRSYLVDDWYTWRDTAPAYGTYVD